MLAIGGKKNTASRGRGSRGVINIRSLYVRDDDWSAVTPVTGCPLSPLRFSGVLQQRSRIQVTRDRDAGRPGKALILFIRPASVFAVRDHHPRPGVNVTRDLSISLPVRVVVSPRTFRSRAARHGVYLSIYPSTPCYSHSSATLPPIWYMYTCEPNDLSLSLSNRFRCTHAPPFGLSREIRFFFFIFLRNTRMYIYYLKITFPRVPFLTIRKFIVFESVRFSSV